jgi:hypothetical protein
MHLVLMLATLGCMQDRGRWLQGDVLVVMLIHLYMH